MRDFRRATAAMVFGAALSFAAIAPGSAAVAPEVSLAKPGNSVPAFAKVEGSFQVAGKKSRKRVRTGAAIVGGIILGTILLNEAAKAEQRKQSRQPSRSEDPWDRCARNFKSFDYNDGSYQPYGGGPREVCPYL